MVSGNALHPIPHPPKSPLVGNMLLLGTVAPLQEMMKLARKFGPIYWLDMMGTPFVVVSSHSLVAELSDEKRFDKDIRGTLRRVRAFSGDGLFTAQTKEPNWSKAHNILLPTFGHRAMQGYHPMMLDIAEQLVLKWERLNPDDEIDVVHDMTALTLDTIGLCGFDYRFNSFYRLDNHPFVDAMVRSLETTMETRGLPLEKFVRQKAMRQLKADILYMNEMVDRIIAERRASDAGGAAKKDLLGHMFSGVDRATGEKLDDLNIRYQCLTFLIAGHETTSGMLSFAIYFLLKNPQVLAKAYAEVDRVLGADPAVKATFEQVNRLTYVTQVLKESLRLWPTAAAYGLYPYENTTIGGQYKLPKKQMILVLGAMLHRDPSVWGENAEVFDPEHFTREAEEARSPHAYKPFGNGQRACIGRQFAMQEAALVLGMILQRFKLIDHADYQLVVKETLTIKPEGLTIKVRPRADADRSAVVRPQPVGVAAMTAAGAAMAMATTKSASAVPRHGTPLVVLFGSNLGTAEEFARHIAEVADAGGFATTLAPLDDFAGKLPKQVPLVIVCGSYNGAAPDNACEFYRWLRSDVAAGSLDGVRYTVFGCGNRDWASTYQTVPRTIDERLAALGAERLHPRGEGDAREDLDGQFQTWFAALRASVPKELTGGAQLPDAKALEALYTVDAVPAPPAGPLVGALGAQPMLIAANRELQTKDGARPSDRSTRHIEVVLPRGAGYRAGDHLSVVPRNGEALVERAASRFGFDRDAHIRLTVDGDRKAFLPVGENIAVRRLLADFVELQQVATRKQIATLAEHTRCPRTRPTLLAYAGDDADSVARYRAEVGVRRKSVLDLLEEFAACELPFNVYLEMLAPMVPRYYSISSSPLAAPGRCSITVGVVEGPARSGCGTYFGICSNHLSRTGEGGMIHAFVKETTAGFRLPDEPTCPIIMVGPGTGLAPFRAFLQERAALKSQGKPVGESLLFFGCRHPQQDFIYADELRGFTDQGVTRLHVAFSRADGPKTYVQHLIADNGEEVFRLLDAGAIVYVCGDGSRMEPDVRRALIDLFCERSGAAAADGEDWMKDLAARNRYVLDVWAGG